MIEHNNHLEKDFGNGRIRAHIHHFGNRCDSGSGRMRSGRHHATGREHRRNADKCREREQRPGFCCFAQQWNFVSKRPLYHQSGTCRYPQGFFCAGSAHRPGCGDEQQRCPGSRFKQNRRCGRALPRWQCASRRWSLADCHLSQTGRRGHPHRAI